MIDATYTRVCQELAADVVYAMTYAEMDRWRNARCRLPLRSRAA